jgi:site-specific DNA-methyltransferase (adenine-specific)
MPENNSLNLKIQQTIDSVEEYKFEPIKGYPMLHWKGKRPFSSTQYYPAQLKENHGEETNNWLNKIFWGDNLQVMSHLLKEYRGQVDLIYIDPPYDSKADYKKFIQLKGAKISNDRTTFEEKQYTDIWTNDEYLQFMFERLILMRELLSDTGTIYLHCDWHKVHHLRLIMDEVFGANNFRNEIIWCYTGASNITNDFPKKHDNILRYSKTDNYYFDKESVRVPYAEGSLDRANRNVIASGGMNFDRIELNENGKVVEDFWEDIINIFELKNDIKDNYDWWKDVQRATRYPNEPVGYPTQKPLKLLERIIKGSSKQGDLIFDCFMGSGTTQAVAMKLGRRFIGADINLGAIQTTTKRLINIAKDLNGKLQEETKYTGFQVYNVNHYDVFRNPLEAKELLLKALEIQPVPNNSLYDGEKDGKMVKIMPINRIATRADLNELITNFDYTKLVKLSEANPNKAVESILLVCMGHEPDLSAELQNAVPFKLDIEVVDILRDKANLEFKRDAEAEIVIEGGKLLIREFYPMNLLQKLSLMKDNVDNWKELTDSIMIDFNYDEGVFTPQIVDVPEGNSLVKGVYPIPANAGTIRVKITDLLSESIEITVRN